ncbi:MAG: dUTP diphosphatase [Acidaminococcaceae bacterium]
MPMKIRGFEKITQYAQVEFALPVRQTQLSAGYDFSLPQAVTLLPQQLMLVPTGIKAYMQKDEYLGIHIRSSLAVKKQLFLVNNQGIIDADYYNNEDNEGHIMLAVRNLGTEPVILAQGERIAQGIFYKYLTVDDDVSEVKTVRGGGFGSTK